MSMIETLRNELAHGRRNLFPNQSLEMLRLCVEILNRLFQADKTD